MIPRPVLVSSHYISIPNAFILLQSLSADSEMVSPSFSQLAFLSVALLFLSISFIRQQWIYAMNVSFLIWKNGVKRFTKFK